VSDVNFFSGYEWQPATWTNLLSQSIASIG
jgi:hypothetical protein